LEEGEEEADLRTLSGFGFLKSILTDHLPSTGRLSPTVGLNSNVFSMMTQSEYCCHTLTLIHLVGAEEYPLIGTFVMILLCLQKRWAFEKFSGDNGNKTRTHNST
jgi:hypothetical protein